MDSTEVAPVQETKPDRKGREKWSTKVDFLFACIGFSVGLGNVWRFPYLCYKNGGGAFLIPYFIAVVVAGIPVFFLEVSLGQFMTEGGIAPWRISPLFQGIGIATMIIVFFLDIYYNVILAWAFYYLFASMQRRMPWSHCDNKFNTEACTTDFKLAYSLALGNASTNGTVSAASSLNVTFVDPATEFWERGVLAISDGLEDIGTIKWDLALCLLLAWIVVYFCICNGIKTSGKVMYVTASSPYILMLVLLVRGATLPGAIDGVKFYMIPEWDRLLDPLVWVDAGTQIFFSMSLALGVLCALGSYNDFHHNCYRDCVIFAVANCGTSILAGFVIFTVLGFMAHEQDVPIDKVAKSGPGLAFIAYPTALAQLPITPLWSVLFFIMVILLGLDSQFVGVEGLITALTDLFPSLKGGSKFRRPLVIAIACLFAFLIGLSMVTNGGMYLFQIFDYYSGSRIIVLVAVIQCIVVSWIYGACRYYDNLEMMFGFRINPWMMICWTFITPAFCLTIFTLSVFEYSELTYGDYVYPQWAIVFGWCTAAVSVLFIPVWMVAEFCRAEGSFEERLFRASRPRLHRHQMRPQDDPSELIPEVDAYESKTAAMYLQDKPRGHDNPAAEPDSGPY